MRILIRGAGEHASAVAHRLFSCGFAVVMTDLPQPSAVRRAVSFCTALYDGSIEVEGVRGVAHPLDRLEIADHVVVVADPGFAALERWRPHVFIDGRILKRNDGNRLDLAPLVIGLGPGLEAGKDVHVVVETHRGHDLGRIVRQGFAAADTGIPGTIAGRTWERVLRAPIAGRFTSDRQIGEIVQQGDLIGQVEPAASDLLEPAAGNLLEPAPDNPLEPAADSHPGKVGADPLPVLAACGGVLRGLIHSGIAVAPRQKLGDIDPRGEVSYCYTLSDKARTISGSVLEIVLSSAMSQAAV